MFCDAFQHLVRQFDRKLPGKQIKIIKKASLKLLPEQSELANKPVRTLCLFTFSFVLCLAGFRECLKGVYTL